MNLPPSRFRLSRAGSAAVLVVLLSGCNTGYQEKDGAFIYATWDEARGRREHAIEDVDPGTFEVLADNGTSGYAKDRWTAYFKSRPIEGADPGSFTALSEHYAKDAAGVYYHGEAIPDADPTTFTVIDGGWARDRQDIYLNSIPIEACDPETFTRLRDGWQRDGRCVYHRGREVPGADPQSFVILNFWYGKDRNGVYSSTDPGLISGPFTSGSRAVSARQTRIGATSSVRLSTVSRAGSRFWSSHRR